MVGKVAIDQIVVMLIGPKYRVAVALQFPATLVNDAATKQLALRIKLEDSGRQRADVPELRLVYRLTH